MKNLLIATIVALTFAACAKNANNNPFDNANQAAKDKDLQGKNFASDCKLTTTGILGTIFSAGTIQLKSYQVVYRVDGANITRTTRVYSDTQCTGDNALIFEEKGDVVLHPDQRTNDQGKSIDVNFSKLFVTTVTADGVAGANTLGLCGASDWSLKSNREETAHSADLKCFQTTLPEQLYTVYRVDANVLYFVTPKAGATATNRPTSALAGDKFTAQ